MDKIKDDGGPAFPVSTRFDPDTGKHGHQDGPSTWQCAGMTLRDYFAAKAMQGFMANKSNPMSFHPTDDAAWAYTIADAMLRAREQP